MRVMPSVNLANVDWNLFLVLHTVLEEGSATKAAKRLHVTQSAVSNALARLRVVLDDPLVVRIGNQLVPTPKARALEPRIRVIVAELSRVLEREQTFDAASSTRRFVLATSDDVELALLGPLCERFTQELPQSSLRIAHVHSTALAQGLGTGEIDAVVGAVQSVPAGSAAEELYEDDLAVVVRAKHPLSGGKVDATRLARYSRIIVESSLDVARCLDAALEVPGVTIASSLVVASFVAAAMALEKSDSFLVAPRRAVEALGTLFQVRSLSFQGGFERLSVSLVWHARTDSDPAGAFFRDLLRAAVKANPSGSPALRTKRQRG